MSGEGGVVLNPGQSILKKSSAKKPAVVKEKDSTEQPTTTATTPPITSPEVPKEKPAAKPGSSRLSVEVADSPSKAPPRSLPKATKEPEKPETSGNGVVKPVSSDDSKIVIKKSKGEGRLMQTFESRQVSVKLNW
eukprot:TRINITY_DN7298_c0_g1_i1.p2 TRINITY_DN7298_c0_g1~~TRINITY_DN7298_c0_g1_i1.p2  ORF type:complete len:135 (-),score=35.74 TRINITY_DN7298_c0_g1_i1:89-493(-)